MYTRCKVLSAIHSNFTLHLPAPLLPVYSFQAEIKSTPAPHSTQSGGEHEQNTLPVLAAGFINFPADFKCHGKRRHTFKASRYKSFFLIIESKTSLGIGAKVLKLEAEIVRCAMCHRIFHLFFKFYLSLDICYQFMGFMTSSRF